MPPTPAQAALGAHGERLAARALTDAGLTLLVRNWRCEIGEIDLVMREGNTLVVVEVKTRSSLAHGTPHEAVTPAKLERLKRLGERYAAEHGLDGVDMRVDLVAVLRPSKGPSVVEHVPGLG